MAAAHARANQYNIEAERNCVELYTDLLVVRSELVIWLYYDGKPLLGWHRTRP
jgi:hypothetical protein